VLTVTAGAIALAGPDQTLCQTVPGPTVFTVNGAGGTPSWSVIGMTGTAMANHCFAEQRHDQRPCGPGLGHGHIASNDDQPQLRLQQRMM